MKTMKTLDTDLAVIGAGPAGLSAALQAAKAGAGVIVIDENRYPGGQLFKQIHKFFGSGEHGAGVRGYKIGKKLLEDVKESGADIMLNTLVYGIFPDNTLGVVSGEEHFSIRAKIIIMATGAKENYLPFPGSTLPGVMGAGAAQTMANINRVLPGKRIVMVGSGNVGLIVSYQLLQAGAEIAAVVEAALAIGGYEVHASKLKRAGVPVYLSHTVQKAYGENGVEGVIIEQIDGDGKPVAGSAIDIKADTVCLAVGLNPMSELAWMMGCKFEYLPKLGGHIPLHDENMKTSIPSLYVAGDLAGVEEASVAMEEGNIAGLSAAEVLGYIDEKDADKLKNVCRGRLAAIRTGVSGSKRESCRTQPDKVNLLNVSGIAEKHKPLNLPSEAKLKSSKVAIIECTQNIPCNPCEKACPFNAIQIGRPITNTPHLLEDKCTGCGRCVAVCPGLAIFTVDFTYSPDEALVEFPFEYIPLPGIGSNVFAVNKEGKQIGSGRVVSIKNPAANDNTPVVAIAVSKDVAIEVRGIKRLQ